PLPLHIESPLAADSFTEFRDRVHILRTLLQGLPMGTSIPVRIVADEWANSKSDIEVLADEKIVDGVHLKMPDTGTLSECVDVVRYLKTKSIFCLLGGSCTETLFSAEVSTHLASVVRPDALLVKPGMGFDEAFSFMHLIMARNFEESNPCLGIKKVGAG
ncbi:MAG: hypothetical protein NTV34_01520, partial [Proteobacteria bacterium]|nr:hypothetical protein [Pseudomonadota bacterium]